jgi:hypothetical protein
MENETKFRLGIVMSLLGFFIMTFEYFEKDRVYQELIVSSSKQIDSLKEEMKFKDNQIGLRDMIIEEVKIKNLLMVDDILKNTEGLTYEK